jgi:hypothetical protein
MRWIKRAAAAAFGIAAIALLVSHFGEEDGGLGSLALGFAFVCSCILLAAGLLAAAVRYVPPRWRPLVLAATLLPLLGAAGALGLPESAIHFSDDAEWAYRAGREISLGALVAGALLAAVVARGHSYRPLATAGVAVLAFALAAAGRDVVARDQQPSWCYADQAEAFDGGAMLTGEYDGCTVLLPAKEV